jgi:FKBP-type peptidyl-prolyl cis-trans isomerase SlyD
MIENGSTVSIEYTLRREDGETVYSNVGEDPLTYTQGNGEILPALEEALLGHEVGDVEEVKLTAEQAHGPINPAAYKEVPLDELPEGLRTVGATLVAVDPDGGQQPIRVHEVREESVILDFNHPLAGQALRFDVKVLAVD